MNSTFRWNTIKGRPNHWTAISFFLVIGLIIFLPNDSYVDKKTYIHNNGEFADHEQGFYPHPRSCQETRWNGNLYQAEWHPKTMPYGRTPSRNCRNAYFA